MEGSCQAAAEYVEYVAVMVIGKGLFVCVCGSGFGEGTVARSSCDVVSFYEIETARGNRKGRLRLVSVFCENACQLCSKNKFIHVSVPTATNSVLLCTIRVLNWSFEKLAQIGARARW